MEKKLKNIGIIEKIVMPTYIMYIFKSEKQLDNFVKKNIDPFVKQYLGIPWCDHHPCKTSK